MIQGDAATLASSLQLWLDASDTSNVTLTYNSTGTTATGSSGANTITVGSNTGLVVGERIQLGGASDSFAASVNDNAADGIYTITNISGTTITLDANLGSSYTGATLYGGFVSQLTDKSGQGNNATQSTAANMPLWISNGQNGLGVASFNGSSDYLTNSSLAWHNSAYSLFATASLSSNNGTYQRLFNADYYIFLGTNNGNIATFTGSGGSWNDVNTNSPSISLSNAYGIIGAVVNGSTLIPYVDNSAQNSKTGTTGAFTGYYIGVNNNGYNNQFWNGPISETIAYNTALSANAQALINQYQSAKWGIALTGPGNATGEAGLTGAEAQSAMASTQAGATTDGYSVFTTGYLNRLSQNSNIILQAGNNVTLDLQSDVLTLASGKSLTLTAGNQIINSSAGTISTNNAGITFNATGGIVLNNNLTLNSGGGNITLNGTVDGAHNLTVNAGSGSATFTGTIGGSTGLGTFNVTAGNGITLNAVKATSISLDSSGGAGNIGSNNSGILDATSGTITVNSGGAVNFANIGMQTVNQNVSVTAAGDASLNAINSGTGSLTVSGNNIYLYGGGSQLVGYWNFNEGAGTTAYDDSGNGNNGTINGATYSTSTPTGTGDSLSFNGGSQYVSVPNSSSLTPSAVSFGSWVQLGATGQTGPIMIKMTTSGSYITSWQLNMNANNTVNFLAQNGSTNIFSINSTTALTLGNWYYVAGTFNASQAILYINGTAEATASGLSGGPHYVSGTQILGIGAYNYGGWNGFFNGRIDDPRVYNTTLSSSDVSALYNGTATSVGSWNVGTTNITATGNISLDLKGDSITASAGKNITMTAGGNITSASNGTVQTSGAGNISLVAGGNVTIANALHFSDSGTGNVSMKAAGDIVESGGGDITTQGGSITLDSDSDASSAGAISLGSGTTLTSNGGNITLGGGESNPASITAGTGYAYGDASNPQGIYLNNATISSGAGNIVMNGTAYSNNATANLDGILIYGGSPVQSTSGAITLYGQGGTGNTDGYNWSNTGISVYGSGSTISSATGAITLNGTGGGGSAAANSGVAVDNSGSIQSTGAGGSAATITINGTGGSTTANEAEGFGIGRNGVITTVDGNVTINATGGDTPNASVYNDALWIGGGSSITSTGAANIVLNAVLGTGSPSVGLYFQNVASPTLGGPSDTGNITISTDSITTVITPTIETTGTVTIKPNTASTTIGVAGGAGTLGITSSILNNVTAGEVDIGATTDTGLLTANAYNWGENTKWYSGTGGITINGAQTMNAHSFFAQTSGASDITLGASGSVTSTAANTAITLVSGRNFINNNGSGALSASSGRWLVYSTDPASNTLGGLNAGFTQYSCTYGGSCGSIPATGNGFLYTTTAPATSSSTSISPSIKAQMTLPVTNNSTAISGGSNTSSNAGSGSTDSNSNDSSPLLQSTSLSTSVSGPRILPGSGNLIYIDASLLEAYDLNPVSSHRWWDGVISTANRFPVY